MIDLDACREFSERYLSARALSASVHHPLPIGRPTPVLTVDIPPESDRRPPALSRAPCLRCGTRGDIGCGHQRPYVADDLPSFEHGETGRLWSGHGIVVRKVAG